MKTAHVNRIHCFASCMFLALSNGLDTDRGLDLAQTLVTICHDSKINDCSKNISNGETFSEALLHSIFFRCTQLVAIGSKTGSMDEVMQHICTSCEDDTDARLSRFISVIEPAMVILLCIFIGFILVSFLLPLLGIISSMGVAYRHSNAVFVQKRNQPYGNLYQLCF